MSVKFRIDDFNNLEVTFITNPTLAPVLHVFEYVEHVQQHLPGVALSIGLREDDTDFIQQSLFDGAEVTCTLTNSTVNHVQVFNLRVFGTPTPTVSDNGEGYNLSITCTLNYPKFFHSVAKTGYQGSVSLALASIAKDCGLTIDSLQTGESQMWFSYGRTYADMVQYLVSRCYVSETSLPASCIVAPGRLVVRDVFAELRKGPKYKFLYKQSYLERGAEEERKRAKTAADTTYVFHEYKSSNVTGVLNSSSGYGNTFIQHSLLEVDKEKYQQTFQRDVANSELNKKLKSEISTTAINYLPFDTGNTYSKFYETYAKNIRLRDLLSNVVKLVSVGTYSKASCLDIVELAFDRKNASSKDITYAGKYIVLGKTINITRNVYREMLTVVNYGRQMSNSNLL